VFGKYTPTEGAAEPASRPWPGPARSKTWGPEKIVLTSMDADGTKNGYDLEITRAVSEAVHIPVVASGGRGQTGASGRCHYRGQSRRRAGGQHFPFR